MASDFDHVTPGQPLEIGARPWNAMLDAAQDFLRRKGKAGAGPLESPLEPSLKCLVKYDASSSSTLAAFSVVAYGDALIDPATDEPTRLNANRRPAFTLATPTRATAPFAITTEPIKGQTFGQAIAHGFAAVTVNVSNTGHTRARPIVGSTAKLESCTSGGVPIISRETGTGDVWAMVLLDFAETGSGSDPKCNRWLRVPKCGTLSITEVLGACGCVPTPQTASLTRNSAGALTSTDLIYGCPPGVTTATFCAGGSAPRRYSFSLAGLTGDCSVMNGGWTIAYTTGNTWVGTKGGYTATLTFSGSGADGALTFTDATYAEVLVYTIENANCCSTITTFERDTWTCHDPPASVTLTPATACGAGPSYTPIFDHDTTGNIRRPRFRLRPTAGSGAADILFGDGVCGIDGNGKPYIEFSTSDAKFCTGDAEACGDHKVTFRITCTACTPEEGPCEDCLICSGWGGPGWYCVGGTGCEYLEEDPGSSARLCGGPYEEEVGCAEVCENGNPYLTDELCGLEPFPEYMLVKVTVAEDNTCTACEDWPEGGVEVLSKYTEDTHRWGITINYPEGCVDTFSCSVIMVFAFTCDGSGGLVGVPNYGSIGCSSEFGDGGNIYFPDSTLATPNVTIVDGPDYDPFYIKYKLTIVAPCGTYSMYIEVWSAEKGCATNNPPAGEDPGQDQTGSDAGAYFFGTNDEYYECPNPYVTYNCVPGFGCVAVYDGSGEYATEAECLADSCEGGGGGSGSDEECGIADGDPAALHVTGGDFEGDYPGIWTIFGDYWRAAFVIPGLGNTVYAWITRPAASVSAIASLTRATYTVFGDLVCNPLELTFDSGMDLTLAIEGATGATVD